MDFISFASRLIRRSCTAVAVLVCLCGGLGTSQEAAAGEPIEVLECEEAVLPGRLFVRAEASRPVADNAMRPGRLVGSGYPDRGCIRAMTRIPLNGLGRPLNL